jgi:hypothetical protein
MRATPCLAGLAGGGGSSSARAFIANDTIVGDDAPGITLLTGAPREERAGAG